MECKLLASIPYAATTGTDAIIFFFIFRLLLKQISIYPKLRILKSLSASLLASFLAISCRLS